MCDKNIDRKNSILHIDQQAVSRPPPPRCLEKRKSFTLGSKELYLSHKNGDILASKAGSLPQPGSKNKTIIHKMLEREGNFITMIVCKLKLSK